MIAFTVVFWCLLLPLFGAMILRAACALNNRIHGQVAKEPVAPVSSSDAPPVAESDPLFSDSYDRPYASPNAPLGPAKSLRQPNGRHVPAPGFGKSFVIFLATHIVVVSSNIGFQYLLGPKFGLVYPLLMSFAVLYFVLSAILARFLPTNYRNAFAISSLGFAIAIAMLIFVVVTTGVSIYFVSFRQ